MRKIFFIGKSYFKEYRIDITIYKKNSNRDKYLSILYGDINYFDIKGDTKKNIIQTISAGKLYGYIVKEKYKYNLIPQTNISLISINKKSFDDLIININKRKGVTIIIKILFLLYKS